MVVYLPAPVFWTVMVVGTLILIYRVLILIIYPEKRGEKVPPDGVHTILYRNNYCAARYKVDSVYGEPKCKRILQLTVTNDEIWTTFSQPYTIFADVCSFRHRILKSQIISINEGKERLLNRSIVIKYKRKDSKTAWLTLFPHDYDKFKQALDVKIEPPPVLV